MKRSKLPKKQVNQFLLNPNDTNRVDTITDAQLLAKQDRIWETLESADKLSEDLLEKVWLCD